MTTSGVRTAPAGVSHERGAAGHDFCDGLNDGRTNRTFRLFVIPVKPAVALLKDIGEAGKHNHFTEEVGVGVITVAEGHDKSQPSGCLLEEQKHGNAGSVITGGVITTLTENRGSSLMTKPSS